MKTDSNAIFASVNRVLKQFTRSSNDPGWIVERLDEGAQAGIFAVRTRDRKPIWQGHPDLAVKLYKPAADTSVEIVREQYELLTGLHNSLNGSTLHGWNICTPAPLFLCEQPLALVMTMVPGKSLNTCMETDGMVPPEMLKSIAQTVVAAMDRFWSVDSQPYGDLNFDNILCDGCSKSLSFVDPGVVADVFACESVDGHWFPASRDLAYLLYETGVAVKKTLGNPAARQRRQWLVENVVREFMMTIGSSGEQKQLLQEIEACVQEHLKKLHASWSLRGLWHIYLRQIAARRIGAVLESLRADAMPSSDGLAYQGHRV